MTTNKVKSVVIVNDYDYIEGGASKVAIKTAELLVKKNIDVYYFSGTNNPEKHIKGVKYYSTNQGEALKSKNKIKGAINNIYNRKAKQQLESLLKKLDKETTVVHCHGWTKSLSSSIFSATSNMEFNTVLTMHDYFLVCPNGGFYNYKKNTVAELRPWQYLFINCDSRNYFFQLYRLIRLLVQNKIVKAPKKIKNYIAVSNFNKKVIERNIKIENIEKIDNPVEILEDVKKRTKKENFYLYVGRVVKEKGIEIFCKTITNCNQKGIVIGDGKLLKTMRNQFPKIKFIGWQNEETIQNYMKKAKALIFPSEIYENAPLVISEALALELPCIVHKKYAAASMISSENGLIFNSEKELEKILKTNQIDKINLKFRKVKNDDYAKKILDYYNKMLK